LGTKIITFKQSSLLKKQGLYQLTKQLKFINNFQELTIDEKAKPVEKQGRKATDLYDSRAATKITRLFILNITALC
jgi:hypothetical protein